MEFPFEVNTLFPSNIVKVGRDLLPECFTGTRRDREDAVIKISNVLDEIGQKSAYAQDLNVAITSAERLRNSNQIVYILTDPDGAEGKGTIVGMLKVGRKNLFLFDETGKNYEMQALCILDFYIHESKQRMGYGLVMYEHMLREENISPQHLAIDRPSLKLLKFLQKHYGLEKILPQSNNFVVFDGFFTDRPDSPNQADSQSYTQMLGAGVGQSRCSVGRINILSMDHDKDERQQQTTGRYAAYKPPSTMGKILQTSSINSVHKQREETNLQYSGANSQQNSGRFMAYNPPATMGNIMQSDVKNSFQQTIEETVMQHDAVHSKENFGRHTAYNPASTMGDFFQTGTEHSFQHNNDSDTSLNVPVTVESQNGAVASPQFCRLDSHETPPAHRDLKFYHTQLWKTQNGCEARLESNGNPVAVGSGASVWANPCTSVTKCLNGWSE
ncbi:alpha-tubulin N-acetyltransferase-like [Bacillus rossius redtenbacheri]|uniref:alpha-tubulin N-acetyltransferase-like n=1 Tax=Bacillus rossius redtenbacheri TaxID=93214 RepID=UPI002FDD6F95